MRIKLSSTDPLTTNARRAPRRASRLLAATLGGLLFAPASAGAASLDCDPWAQSCGHDEKCVSYVSEGGGYFDSLACVPVEIDSVGDPCTSTLLSEGPDGYDTCGADAMCWDLNEEAEGTCVALCTGTVEDPSCGVGTACVHATGGVLNICLPTCDPVLVDCPGDEVCVPNGDTNEFVCVLDASMEGGGFGDPCEYANQCDVGLLCAEGGYVPGCQDAGCCTYFCDVQELDVCPGNTSCTPWFEEWEAPPGFEHVGVCVGAP